MTWSVDYHEPFSHSDADARGWLWHLSDESGATRRVYVEITGIALEVMKAPRATLLKDTREAIESEGRSEVAKILDKTEPPAGIQCGTGGCRCLTREELGLLKVEPARTAI